MSNEIKQGDKVKVSKDAPKVYLSSVNNLFKYHACKVEETDGDSAKIRYTDIGIDRWLAIPVKYLVNVDAEEKEEKIKLGDMVRIKGNLQKVIKVENRRDCAGHIYTLDNGDSYIYNIPEDCIELVEPTTPKYNKGDRVKICSKNAERFGRVGTILEVYDNGTVVVDFNDYYVGGHLYSVDFIEPYTEPTAPTIKVGDRVRNINSDLCGIALNIEHGIVEVGIPYDKERHYWNTDIVELFEPTEQTEAEKPNHTITIPVEVDLTDSYWDAYAADLAKEVALKVANKYNDPEQAAEYAVQTAEAVVAGLKRKWV